MKREPPESDPLALAAPATPDDALAGVSGPPQFGLRSLLLAMAVVAALCAVMQAVGMYAFLVLLFFLGLICAHVVGNALGTRLRAQGDRLARGGARWGDPPPTSGRLPAQISGSRLAKHGQLPRALRGCILLGAGAGGLTGGSLITIVCREHITTPGILLAVISSAALGGLAGFLAGSFYSVARGALHEALGKLPPDG